MIAPIATAAAKSIAVHWERVRRWATRRPSTAVPYISAALPKTPTSSSVWQLNHAGMAPPAHLVGAGHLPIRAGILRGRAVGPGVVVASRTGSIGCETRQRAATP